VADFNCSFFCSSSRKSGRIIKIGLRYVCQSCHQGRFCVRAGGIRAPTPPDSLVAPQIQKLADRSDVISEVPKCSKIQIFRIPLGELAALPQTPSWWGGGSLPLPRTVLRPSGLVSTGLRSNPLQSWQPYYNDRFQM